MDYDDFEKLVTRLLSTHTKLTRIPSDQGSALLRDDNQRAMVITLDTIDDDVLLLAPLDIDVTALGLEQMTTLLQRAYVGQGLGGAAVGLEETSGTLVLWQRVPAIAANEERLTRIIERLGEARLAFD